MGDVGEQGGARGKGQPPTGYAGGRGGDSGLAERLSELARSLESEADVAQTLDAIVHGAVGTVPGARHASISTIVRRREVTTQAATDELSRAVDDAQYRAGQGPCLDTLYEQQTVRLPDLAGETRWPGFVTRVRELRVGSMLSLRLYVAGDDLGALNLSSEEPDAFVGESEHVGLLFAAHAAVAMAGAQQLEQLRGGMASRDLIGTAKGILMERYKISGDRAFGLLVRFSQNENRKLHEIAEDLVRTGELPGVGNAGQLESRDSVPPSEQ